MFSRTKEFLLILALVAVITMILSRKGTREVESRGAARLNAWPTPENIPFISLSSLKFVPTPERSTLMRDLQSAIGTTGYKEVEEIEPMPIRPSSLRFGRELYIANCSGCHGNELDGTGKTGRTLELPPTNLLETDTYKYGKLHLGIYRSTYYGVEGTGMPPWGDILKPQEIWDITHYIVAYRAAYESR